MTETIYNDAPAVAEALEALAADERDGAAKYHMSVAAKLLRGFHAGVKRASPSEADQRDAARYRWLRSAGEWDSPIVKLGYDDYEVAQGEELDAAIDAAMQSDKEESK